MGAEGPPSSEYLIIRPEKIRFIDILSLLILRRSITSYGFVESSAGSDEKAGGGRRIRDDWVTPLVVIVMKVLDTIKTPLLYAGYVIEFFLNLFALNGGILGLIWRTITGIIE